MVLELDGTLYQITYFQHVKPGKGGAFVRTKLKSVLTGGVVDRTFRAGEKVQEAVKRGEVTADGIVDKARAGADEIRRKADQDIEFEAQKAQIELRDSVVSLAIGAAEKVIGERLDDDLHRKLITEYIEGLKPYGGPSHA